MNFPLERIDVDNLKLDPEAQKPDSQPGTRTPSILRHNLTGHEHDEMIGDDNDYDYCYKNILVEIKEWYLTVTNLEQFLQGVSNTKNL